MEFLIEYGREHELSRAEAEMLFGQPKSQNTRFGIYEDDEPVVSFERMGGAIRIAEVLYTYDSKSEIDVRIDYLLNNKLVQFEGVRDVGFSFIGMGLSKEHKDSILKLKKALAAAGKKVRVIFGPNAELNAAQVIRNRLTGPGVEVIFACSAGKCYIAKTAAIQDIDEYAKRDYGKPCRDMEAGMLPPKLAQIAINLGIGTKRKATIYDPFCGSGTVLTEAALSELTAIGSDIAPRMVECAATNIEWLSKEYGLALPQRPFVHDAARPFEDLKGLDAVITEGTLGPVLTKLPSDSQADAILSEIIKLYIKFLTWIFPKLKPKSKVVLMIPLYGDNFPERMLDAAEGAGYTSRRFFGKPYLAYRRPNQITGRAIVVLEKRSV